jgi:cell wall-associated NlpC family hydrolase
LKFSPSFVAKFVVCKPLVGTLVGVTAISSVWGAAAFADPAEDALAKLTELSRQAEQLTETMHTAQIDLDNKIALQNEAIRKHTDDLAALDAAKAQLTSYQGNVDKLAASVYMGGRTDGMNAMLTAASPQNLIDKMSVQRVMAIEMAQQMQGFRQASQQALTIEAASAKSAADAAAAADDAAAVRADLQRKQSELQVQITAVKARYATLTAAQQAALAAPAALPPSVLATPAPNAAPSDVASLAALPIPGGGGGGSGLGASAVQAALSRIGSPYVWAAAGPNAFDCSGLVQWAFRQAGVVLPRSSYALAAGGQPVSLDQMQPGDIVTQYSDASHVGIYVGDGLMVHASTYGIPVRVESVHSAPIYNVRRY